MTSLLYPGCASTPARRPEVCSRLSPTGPVTRSGRWHPTKSAPRRLNRKRLPPARLSLVAALTEEAQGAGDRVMWSLPKQDARPQAPSLPASEPHWCGVEVGPECSHKVAASLPKQAAPPPPPAAPNPAGIRVPFQPQEEAQAGGNRVTVSLPKQDAPPAPPAASKAAGV